MLISSQVENETDVHKLSLRQQLAVALRVLHRHGIADNAAGHITLRKPGTNTWWTNPWNYDWETIQASDLIRIDADSNILEGHTDVSQFLDLHFLLYQYRPELNCVIHNHPYYTTLYSALQQPLYILDQQSCLFYENHLIYDEYKGLAQGLDLTRPVVEAMGQYNAAILKTHGLNVCADSLDIAVFLAVYLERAAKFSWEASQNPKFNPETDQMKPDVAAKTQKAFLERKVPLIRLNWEAMSRQVLRLTPDVLD